MFTSHLNLYIILLIYCHFFVSIFFYYFFIFIIFFFTYQLLIFQLYFPFLKSLNCLPHPYVRTYCHMIRTYREEWGNPNEDKYFKYMESYSPYDNVAAQDYPAILGGRPTNWLTDRLIDWLTDWLTDWLSCLCYVLCSVFRLCFFTLYYVLNEIKFS